MRNTRLVAGLAVAGLASAGVLAVAATAFADTPSPSSTPSASGTAKPGQGEGQRGGDRAAQHTTVTGAEAQRVIDAVQAKASGVTITTVEADADGSYDASGTKADGTKVRYEVSKDLATITERTGGPGGGHGRGGERGPGGASQDTPVTGDEATKVKDAVTAKNAGATITEVRKDPDGSYDAVGTDSSGAKVMYDVSEDLSTVTARTGR